MELNIIKNFVVEECPNCGVMFAISERLERNLRATKKTFHCPNGHAQSYTKSTADVLAEEVEEKKKRIASLELAMDYKDRQYKILEKKCKSKKSKK